MSLFPWAHYKSDQHAIKLHTLLDLRGNIPTVIRITPAQLHDVHFLDHLVLEPGAFYVMDRGYLDFARLHRWTQAGAFFVTRASKNFRFQRLVSHPVEDKTGGVQCDQTISLKWFYSVQGYPGPLRRVRFRDPITQKKLVFLTNNFTLPALTIADLYRSRWQVELFFKWIKQHLRIKAFYGTSRQRGQDAGLDRRLRLRAGGHRQEAAEPGAQPLHNPANPERDAFRENAHFAGLFARIVQD